MTLTIRPPVHAGREPALSIRGELLYGAESLTPAAPYLGARGGELGALGWW